MPVNPRKQAYFYYIHVLYTISFLFKLFIIIYMYVYYFLTHDVIFLHYVLCQIPMCISSIGRTDYDLLECKRAVLQFILCSLVFIRKFALKCFVLAIRQSPTCSAVHYIMCLHAHGIYKVLCPCTNYLK